VIPDQEYTSVGVASPKEKTNGGGIFIAGNHLRNTDLDRADRTLKQKAVPFSGTAFCYIWWRRLDLNQRPSGYEPDELPGCSTPRRLLFLLNSTNITSLSTK
jgi:hypothetical protein